MTRAPVTYAPGFVKEHAALFAALDKRVIWERREDAPRRECWMSRLDEAYTYGRGAGMRTYEARSIPAELEMLWNTLETTLSVSFEGCFANAYDGPRDHLGWHADDSPEIDDARPIAVVSLGSARRIEFRPKGAKGAEDKESLLLEPGSLLLMGAGMQSSHEHRIPKNGEGCGPRISLTWRGLVPHR